MRKEFDLPDNDLAERASWARLIGDHDRIARMCRALAAVSAEPVSSRGKASGMLARLAVVVADHLGVEREMVDMTAVAMAANYSVDTVIDMQATLDLLKQDWKAFIARWLPTIEADGWTQFGIDAAAMLPRLSRQVEQENRLLYDGAVRYGIIGLGHTVVH